MKIQIAFACFVLLCAQTPVSALALQSTNTNEKPAAFSFAGVAYFHRFTVNDQQEFTPRGQENLETWTDMVTMHRYPQAKTGEALAAIANAVLENYKANGATVVRTDSVPRTKAKPAEHLIVVMFKRREFTEIAFARFKMNAGVGTAAIYSHRAYGKTAGDVIGTWIERNAEAIERTLMTWNATPTPPNAAQPRAPRPPQRSATRRR